MDKTDVSKYLHNRVQSSIFLHPAVPSEIIILINSLSSNKSPGHDEIPIIFIKQAVQIIAPIIASLINFSFQLGSFPNNLKIAKVVPVPKSRDKTLLNNYRPTSLLTSFSKIFEKVIHSQLMGFLKKFCSYAHSVRISFSSFYHSSNTRHCYGCI